MGFRVELGNWSQIHELGKIHELGGETWGSRKRTGSKSLKKIRRGKVGKQQSNR